MMIKRLDENDTKYIDEISDIYSKWWTLNNKKENISYDLINSKNIIETKILVENNKLIGVVQLLYDDNVFIDDYKPFLANLYIKEEYRGNNYSSILINEIIKDSKKLGYKNLYLHSRHINFYEKYGFKFIKEVNNKRIYSLN